MRSKIRIKCWKMKDVEPRQPAIKIYRSKLILTASTRCKSRRMYSISETNLRCRREVKIKIWRRTVSWLCIKSWRRSLLGLIDCHLQLELCLKFWCYGLRNLWSTKITTLTRQLKLNYNEIWSTFWQKFWLAAGSIMAFAIQIALVWSSRLIKRSAFFTQFSSLVALYSNIFFRCKNCKKSTTIFSISTR